LLTHTAGLIEWYPLFYQCDNRQDTYRLIESLPLKYPVGAGRHYSDLGFWLLGEIVEKVSGEPLEDFVRSHLFIPLAMEHTGFLPDTTWPIAATSLGNPYEYRMVRDTSLGFTVPGLDPDSWNGWRQYVLVGEVNDGNAWYAGRGVCGAAGLFSTVEDIQKLLDMLMHNGMVAGQPFISPGTLKTFFTPDKFHNGLGWMMDPSNAFMRDAPAGSFGHTGFTGTSICVVPEQDLDIIILINRQNVGLQPNGSYFNPNPIREGIFKAVMESTKG
ncbi:MAG: serine hydrolase, partial [Saprospiraceae bacterium]|nr:serine hydrolase [Saprospiraceae bacterium]